MQHFVQYSFQVFLMAFFIRILGHAQAHLYKHIYLRNQLSRNTSLQEQANQFYI
jgi:hypothetical protein